MPAFIPSLQRRRGSLSHLLPPMLLALLLLAAIALVSCQTTLRFTRDTQWVSHTHQVLADIAATRSDVEQAEAGQRGYLLTGSPRYLAPYWTARRMLPTDLVALRRLTSDNPSQQSRLDALTPLIQAKLAELQETVNLREQGQAGAALRVVETDRGAALMEQIQAVTAQMEAEENHLLARRVQAAETAGRTGQVLIVAGALLVLALLTLAAMMGGQFQRERMESEAALRRSQEELEDRVAARTSEIDAAVRALQESGQRFRFLADSMPQIVWTTTPDGVTDYYNQRWHKYTGLTLEATNAGGMEAVLHSKDRPLITAGWLRAMAQGQPYTMEYRLLGADGRYRWHLGRVLPLRNEAGEIVMWAGTGTDVDDYKQAQEALQQAHEEAESRVTARTAELATANRTLREDQERLSAVVALQNEVVNAALNVGKVMALAAGSAQALTHAPGAVIELVDGDELVYHTATGTMAASVATRLPIATTLSGLCVQTGRTLHCEDSETDARTDQDLCRRLGIRSMVVVPLRDGGESQGVLKVVSPQPNAFSTHDVQTLEILSGLVSAALNRAAQFEAKQTALDLLGESEAQFRSVIDSMQEGLTVQDREGTISLCNTAAETILGIAADELLGGNAARPQWRIVCEDGTDFPRALHPSQVALKTGLPQPSAIMGVSLSEDKITWLAVSAAPLFHVGQNEPYAVVTTFSDITDRRHSEEAVRRAEEKYRRIYENSVEGIFQTTLSGRVLSANPATARMLGYASPDAAIGELTDIGRQLYQRPEDRARFIALLQAEGQTSGFEVPFRRRDGSVLWVSMSGRLQRDAGGEVEYLEGSLQDITERRASEQRLLDYNIVLEFQKQEMEKTNEELEEVNARLETLATQDGLTGLKNHRVFQERLAEEFGRATRYGTPLSLVMLDVDNFKQFNDAFGHPAGDDVLRAVAGLLQASVRECDFVARYGGEEFALVLPLTDAEGAFTIAERCRAAIEAAKWDKRPITASFGVASLSLVMPAYTALITDADELLYVAKANGRNQVASAHVVCTETKQDYLLSEKVGA